MSAKSALEPHPFDRLTLAELRARRSVKWTYYPEDVLPAWVAEMDVPLAEPITRALTAALTRGDTGYAYGGDLGEIFARWAGRTWGWQPSPRDVGLVCDVVTGIEELLRAATSPGDGVVIEPPVYPPFAGAVKTTGRKVVEVPLVRHDRGWESDLEGLERAYRDGARAHILCSPQNPTGTVPARAALEAIAALAERHGVLVLSDEIHAPLTLSGASHHPFVSVSEAAREVGVVLTSASKAWNIAGLKAAMMIATGSEKGLARRAVAGISPGVPFHAGHFGVLAARAAFEAGDPWLASTRLFLERNRALLGELLRQHLPAVGYRPPEAGYLAWLDFGAMTDEADPARRALERGRVALSAGPTFGREGARHARLNFATTSELLTEAVLRLARAFSV